MSDSEKLSVAGLLYVTLRRKLNRVIDVEWLLHNEDYAREIMRLARKQGNEELVHYADRLDQLLFGTAIPEPVVARAEPVVKVEEDEAAIASQYIGALR